MPEVYKNPFDWASPIIRQARKVGSQSVESALKASQRSVIEARRAANDLIALLTGNKDFISKGLEDIWNKDQAITRLDVNLRQLNDRAADRLQRQACIEQLAAQASELWSGKIFPHEDKALVLKRAIYDLPEDQQVLFWQHFESRPLGKQA